MNTTTTFLDFIKEHSIQIPLIQRDYVQGLALNDKAKEKRDEFVKKLLNAILPKEKPYTLDFIYGARDSYDDNNDNSEGPFLPIDGQQRLTTLYLLHWILAVKTNKDGCNNWVLELLKKFSYMTRITSDKFCRRLLSTDFDAEKSLYEQVEDKTWYVSLETDPTVIAIMEMVKQIECTLAKSPYCACLKEMASHLFNNEEQRLTFSLLDMERYHLTDGLYVKMNARGKELTSFENWKADFINLIIEDETIKDRFSNSIEHEWNDLFWKDVYKNYSDEVSKLSEKKDQKKVKYPRIDEHFMNFFTNFSRLYFFIESLSAEPKVEDFNGKVWSTTESLFGDNNELVKKLFDTLDTLARIDREVGIESFFDSLFHTTPSTEWSEQTTKVKLFIGNKNVNLFKSCCEDDNFGLQHVLLYAILKYCTKYEVFTVIEDLRTYARICRNYLYQHNYLDSGKVSIVSQIRVVDMKTYDKVFDYLCLERNPIDSLTKHSFNGEDSKYVDVERNKTVYYSCANHDVLKLLQKTEDMSYCYGYIRAFGDVLDKCVNGTLSCNRVWDAIYSFRNASNLQKAQLFVAFNYEGMFIGNDCAYGKRVLIGGKNGWDVHFRKDDNEKKISKWVTDYVESYSKMPDVKDIIDTERNKICQNPSSMRDYMLKYKHVLAAQIWWHNNVEEAPYYYAMPNPWKDMDAIVIHSFSVRPLGKGYQTCPMTNAVARMMSNYDSSHMGYAGQGSWKGGLSIHDGNWEKVYFSMGFEKTNWIVKADYYSILSPDLQKKLVAYSKDNEKVLYYSLIQEQGDLIEMAVGFMEKVVEELKTKGLI